LLTNYIKDKDNTIEELKNKNTKLDNEVIDITMNLQREKERARNIFNDNTKLEKELKAAKGEVQRYIKNITEDLEPQIEQYRQNVLMIKNEMEKKSDEENVIIKELEEKQKEIIRVREESERAMRKLSERTNYEIERMSNDKKRLEQKLFTLENQSHELNSVSIKQKQNILNLENNNKLLEEHGKKCVDEIEKITGKLRETQNELDRVLKDCNNLKEENKQLKDNMIAVTNVSILF